LLGYRSNIGNILDLRCRDLRSYDQPHPYPRKRRRAAAMPARADLSQQLAGRAKCRSLWIATTCQERASHGGGRLRRYTADGKLGRDIPLPVSQPTMCAFAGDALDYLYVTSASDRLTPEQRRREPLAGAMLRLQPGGEWHPSALHAALTRPGEAGAPGKRPRRRPMRRELRLETPHYSINAVKVSTLPVGATPCPRGSRIMQCWAIARRVRWSLATGWRRNEC
jgi:hypothetical protein